MADRYPHLMGKPRVPSLLQPEVQATRKLLQRYRVHTVCEEARCPNRGECYRERTATFMILGDSCTRACGFCAVKTGAGSPPDREEPARVAQATKELGLSYVVVTSVDRDDLPDGGAEHFWQTAEAIHLALPEAKIEVLVPDFQRKPGAVERVLEAPIFCFAHNIETVPRLYRQVRLGSNYLHSLSLLRTAAEQAPDIIIKSGLMVGLGEETEEVLAVMGDLREAGVSWLTIGQYLQPSLQQLPVARYLPVSYFDELEREAKKLGFKHILSGPLVRSSYHAGFSLPR